MDTLWSIGIELADKVSELTNDKSIGDAYRMRLQKAYWAEQKKAEKKREEDLEYLCGRSKFYPSEL